MEHLASQLATYALEVINSWAGYLTGGVIVAVMSVHAWLRPDWKPKRPIILAVIAVFFFIATFNAWQKQSERVEVAEAKLRNLPNENTPDLQASIDQVAFGLRTMHGHDIPSAMILASIRSLRAPSIAHQYTCNIRTKDGQSLAGEPEAILDGTAIQYSGGTIIYNKSDALYERTAEHPIESGGMRRGALLFLFPKAKERFGPGTDVTIGFVDVLGKGH